MIFFSFVLGSIITTFRLLESFIKSPVNEKGLTTTSSNSLIFTFNSIFTSFTLKSNSESTNAFEEKATLEKIKVSFALANKVKSPLLSDTAPLLLVLLKTVTFSIPNESAMIFPLIISLVVI